MALSSGNCAAIRAARFTADLDDEAVIQFAQCEVEALRGAGHRRSRRRSRYLPGRRSVPRRQKPLALLRVGIVDGVQEMPVLQVRAPPSQARTPMTAKRRAVGLLFAERQFAGVVAPHAHSTSRA